MAAKKVKKKAKKRAEPSRKKGESKRRNVADSAPKGRGGSKGLPRARKEPAKKKKETAKEPAKKKTKKKKKKKKKVPQIIERNRAVDTLGEETLRAGSRVLLEKTPRLTPTKNGFRALERYILNLQRSDRKKDRALYSFELNLRFRIPDGTFIETDPISGVVKSPKETDATKAKGETSAHAWRATLLSDIRKAMFRFMDAEGISSDSETIRKRLDRMTKEEVRDAFRNMKRQHSFTFTVSFYREIIEGGFDAESEGDTED